MNESDHICQHLHLVPGRLVYVICCKDSYDADCHCPRSKRSRGERSDGGRSGVRGVIRARRGLTGIEAPRIRKSVVALNSVADGSNADLGQLVVETPIEEQESSQKGYREGGNPLTVVAENLKPCLAWR